MRQLAERIKGSKSSIHRYFQEKKRRDGHPESSLWETKAGSAWLRLMVFAALYVFGLKAGVGAETLSLFFKLIRLDPWIGVSPSALRSQLERMEMLLPKFQEACEASLPVEKRTLVAGMDETFFGQFLILVLMDLRSGYLVLEEISEDRCYDTWYRKVTPRLEQLGITVTHAVSDRARALIKLAVTGFGCESGADVFHVQQDLSRFLGAKVAKRVKAAEKQAEQARADERQAVENNAAETEIAERQVQRQAAEAAVAEHRRTHAEYQDHLQGVARDLHPFSLESGGIQEAQTVEHRLEARVQALESLTQTQTIHDKQGTLKKVRQQITALAVSVDFWWLWVHDTLRSLAVSLELQVWLTTALLPVVYWHDQLQRAQNRSLRERYRIAWEQATETLQAHPLSHALPPSELQRWLLWAENITRQFHRSSSAVEGRNGCLSQMYHNGRGLSEKRLRALTVIHNYGIKREDGTTAATRLFGIEFQDPFEWLLEEMGELPLPRKSRGRARPHPLQLLDVPA